MVKKFHFKIDEQSFAQLSKDDVVELIGDGELDVIGNWKFGTFIQDKCDEILHYCTNTDVAQIYPIAMLTDKIRVFVDPFMPTNDDSVYVTESGSLDKFLVNPGACMVENDIVANKYSSLKECADDIKEKIGVEINVESFETQKDEFEKIGLNETMIISKVVESAGIEYMRNEYKKFINDAIENE